MLTINDPVTAANELRPVLLRLNRQLRRELGPVGITGGQAALLHAIRTNPGIGVRGLAEREGVSAPPCPATSTGSRRPACSRACAPSRTAAASGSTSPSRA